MGRLARFARRTLRPLPAAALVASVYAVLGVLYIRLSSRGVARSSGSVADLERLETLKGEIFILVTGALLFGGLLLMLRRIEAERARLVRLERELAAAEARRLPEALASSLVHDLDNVLQIALLQAGTLGAEPPSPRAQEAARGLERALAELASFGHRLREIGRVRAAEAESSRFEVASLVEDVAELARAHGAVRVRRLERDVRVGASLTGDRALLGRALLNLVLNAAQAARRGPVLLRAREGDGEVVLEVHDDGPGVPAGLEEGIFQPFYSTREGGGGLGLVSVRVAAEAFAGEVEVTRSHLGGACFRLRLPLAPGTRPGPRAR
jgi:two-component system sensor histidine kinase FlrB